MPPSDFSSASADAIESAAAQWLARLDRGLAENEQSEFTAWREADLRHEAAFLRLEKVWGALDQVALTRPALPTAADPDALEQPRRRARWIWAPLLAAAAAGVFVFFSGNPAREVHPRPHAIVHPGPQRIALEDGSIVDLRPGARMDVKFTPDERHVRLLEGEAFFTVAKNPARPFIVSVNEVTVRAVGTAFSVGLDPQEISVLVTEGRVRVDEVSSAVQSRELSALAAGQQGVIALAADPAATGSLAVKVSQLTRAEIDQALAWQGLHLEFIAVPLGDVVADFNRYNHRKLVVADEATAAILIGGNFRADNLDAFIRLLSKAFEVSAFPHGDEIVLRQVHGR